MNLLAIIETLRRNLKTVVLGCYGVLALVVVADVVRILAAHGEGASAHEPAAAAKHAAGFWTSLYHIAEHWPVFWTVFGLLGCVLLVIISKTYGHAAVSKQEGYYDE